NQELAAAERSRREFTANVSHELKTPLQSIIGSAELLENGMVAPQDVPRFVGRIRTEAQRLVALVEDILHLSQMDEGVELPREEVELLELCREVRSGLTSQAAAKEVILAVHGEPATVFGVRALLHELVYNLCDNAIKYNVEGGSVEVDVTRTGQTVTLTVADTGIGIPREYQDRVFERFFRVDKSRSKQSGGTGLGLAIVKHAAQLHGAALELTSQEGRGTTVTVIFPSLGPEG
ncbi:MAG: ATP-binding protein, partial [Oscillospiraceae bacterium]|nr:ATP-binding protein [Oscillospiraceae bacterium]